MGIEISTVGDLRRAIGGAVDAPDDQLIVAQVVAVDGKAWNMIAEFTGRVPGGTIGVLTLRHPALRTLPEEAFTGARCDVPPPGWWCSRSKGHDGPCAARPTEPKMLPGLQVEQLWHTARGRMPDGMCGTSEAIVFARLLATEILGGRHG